MAAQPEQQPQQQQQQPPAGAPQEPAEGKAVWQGTSAEHAQQMVDKATQRNPMVKFMLDKMAEAGCGVGKEFIQIENCTAEVGGGFRPPDGVVICHNHLSSQEEINHALTHELVHAYDHCRASNLDWTNCQHHACSEIRAAMLSGDCDFKMELLRGNVALRGQFQKCVRRRAELSVSMNPHCSRGRMAAAAVDAVFDRCFADTAPFDRIP
ncbi:hypothetical protein COHA_005065 [Chlorella ohadii]|uniref:Mitochondrial inner membrane protease ATP23 n=1 Tax=Chlorella ohadii TaxID=2649997 RepID=A0AAD5DRP6_9CHLO|nr:hypothetical protein COHA_005065 [Chlorella ohadii]